MDTELVGNRTKLQLDHALRVLLRRKPLEQIRIQEVAKLCPIRRQNFYYHFEDLYQLLDWSVNREREALLRRQEDCLTWQQALLDLLLQADRDRLFYLAVRENRGRDGLRELFRDALDALSRKALAYYGPRSGEQMDPAAEEAQAECCTAMLLTLLDGWLSGDVHQTPQELVAMLERTVRQTAEGTAWRNQMTVRK